MNSGRYFSVALNKKRNELIQKQGGKILIIIQEKSVVKPTERSNLQNAMKRDVEGLETGFEP